MKTFNEYIALINELAPRIGPPPLMTPTNPQEQLEQFPTDWTIIENLAAFASSLANVVERPTLIAPPGSRALTFDVNNASENRKAFMVDLEFAHIHNPPIGSMHLTLPEPIRRLAIKKKWALRHPLAVREMVSPDVTFVFAPRDLDELKWAKLLLEVAHAYASKVQ